MSVGRCRDDRLGDVAGEQLQRRGAAVVPGEFAGPAEDGAGERIVGAVPDGTHWGQAPDAVFDRRQDVDDA
jgi:hypothetical protein